MLDVTPKSGTFRELTRNYICGSSVGSAPNFVLSQRTVPRNRSQKLVLVQSKKVVVFWKTHRNPKRKRGSAFGPRSRFGLQFKSPNCTTTPGQGPLSSHRTPRSVNNSGYPHANRNRVWMLGRPRCDADPTNVLAGALI